MNHQHCLVRSDASQGFVPVAETFSTRRKTSSCSTLCRASAPVHGLADNIRKIRIADLPVIRIFVGKAILNQDNIRTQSSGQGSVIKADGGLIRLFAKAGSGLACTVDIQMSILVASSVMAEIWLTDFKISLAMGALTSNSTGALKLQNALASSDAQLQHPAGCL